jgi:PBSX family phage terminase large subunit
MANLFEGRIPLPKQKTFLESPKRYVSYVGGFGSGKSIVGCWRSIILAMMYPGNLGIICRNTYPELRDTTMRTFFEECPEEIIHKFNKVENLLTFKPVKGSGKQSQIIFRSLDNYEKFRSLEIGYFFIDEASEVKEEAFLTLCGRLRNPNADDHFGFITSNPSTTRHWMYKRFVEGDCNDSSQYQIIRAPTSENRKHLPEGYEDGLREVYDEQWINRYLEGEFGFIVEGQPVYPEFKESENTGDLKFDPSYPIMRSWDFGLHHPAVVIAQVIETQGGSRLNVLEEIQGDNKLIEDFSNEVIKHCEDKYGVAQYKDFCDPAGNQKSDKSPKTSVQILRSKGIYPLSSHQNILDGVQILRMMLHRKYRDGKPALIVNRSCTILSEGFIGGYSYPKKYDGSGEDPNPAKDGYYDHLQDALRYMVWNSKFKTWLKAPVTARKKPAGSFDSWRKMGKKRGSFTQSFRV